MDYRAIQVKWVDSVIYGNQELGLDEITDGVAILLSTGYLVQDEEEFITIARDFSTKDKQFRGILTIPRIAIVFIEELKPQFFPLT